MEQLKMALDIQPELKDQTSNIEMLIKEHGLKRSYINNRRYLGNKYSLTDFIRKTVDDNCKEINIVADIFSGTGAVSDAFRDKMIRYFILRREINI